MADALGLPIVFLTGAREPPISEDNPWTRTEAAVRVLESLKRISARTTSSSPKERFEAKKERLRQEATRVRRHAQPIRQGHQGRIDPEFLQLGKQPKKSRPRPARTCLSAVVART